MRHVDNRSAQTLCQRERIRQLGRLKMVAQPSFAFIGQCRCREAQVPGSDTICYGQPIKHLIHTIADGLVHDASR